MTPVEQITSLYIGYFGRAPDPEGLNYWVGRLADGYTLAEAAESFSVQAESTAKYPYLANPNIASPQAFIAQVYMNLFNRAPDAEGLAYWTAELQNGADVGDFILNVISGAVTEPDATIVANKVEVGVDFALEAANVAGFVYDANAADAAVEVINGVDATDASVEAAKAETDAFIADGGGVVGGIFTLTEDAGEQRVGTGDDDTFNAVLGTDATINNFDNVEGGAGNDTLNIIFQGGAAAFDIADSASISGVENINIVAGAATGSIDAGDFEGSARIRQAGATAISVEGLTNQTVVFSDAVAGVTYDAGATAASVELDGADDAAALNVDGIDLTSLTITGSVEAVDGTDETLTVTTTNELPAAGNDGSDITTVTVSLTNAVDLTVSDLVETVTFDASGSAALDTDLSALVNLETATFGEGADEVDAAISDEADTSFDLGAGNDVFTLNGTGDTDNSLTTVTLGEGNDTIAISTALSNISDASEAEFESGLITVADFDADADVLSLLTGVSAGFETLTNTEIGNVSAATSLFAALDLAASYVDTGANDAVAFNYGGDAYILVNGGASITDFDNGDGLIKLAGVNANDLDASSFLVA